MAKASILAAGIVRDVLFASIDDLDRFIEKLDFNGINYCEVERRHGPNGMWVLRVVTQYNNCELVEL